MQAMQADTTGYGSVGYNYNIGKYEVTAGQYTEFLNAVAVTDTYGLYNTYMDTVNDSYGCKIKRSGASGSYTYSVASDWANRPVNYVSWGDSARFANWLHNGQPTGVQGLATTEDGAYYLNGATTDAQLMAVNREADWRWAITSENEWYKAAYYKGGSTSAGYWDYPTSSDTAPGNDMADAFGNNANSTTTLAMALAPTPSTPASTLQSPASSRTPRVPTAHSIRAATSGSGTRPCGAPVASGVAVRSTTTAASPFWQGSGVPATRRTRASISGSVSPRFLSRRRLSHWLGDW